MFSVFNSQVPGPWPRELAQSGGQHALGLDSCVQVGSGKLRTQSQLIRWITSSLCVTTRRHGISLAPSIECSVYEAGDSQFRQAEQATCLSVCCWRANHGALFSPSAREGPRRQVWSGAGGGRTHSSTNTPRYLVRGAVAVRDEERNRGREEVHLLLLRLLGAVPGPEAYHEHSLHRTARYSRAEQSRVHAVCKTHGMSSRSTDQVAGTSRVLVSIGTRWWAGAKNKMARQRGYTNRRRRIPTRVD